MPETIIKSPRNKMNISSPLTLVITVKCFFTGERHRKNTGSKFYSGYDVGSVIDSVEITVSSLRHRMEMV